MNPKIWIQDIDGCLNDYPNEFVAWAAELCSTSFKDLNDMKAKLSSDEYQKVKDTYRSSGQKRRLTILPEARDVLAKVAKTHQIWVVTSRPVIHQVEADTEFWLKKNEINFTNLIFNDAKADLLLEHKDDIDFIVDDDFSHCTSYSKHYKNSKIILMNIHNKKHQPLDGVYECKNWSEINKLYERSNEKN